MKTLFVFGIVAALFLGGCKKDNSTELETGHLEIQLVHTAAGNLLELDKPITTPLGEPLTITHFAYYLSHLELQTTMGDYVSLPLEYYLVNEKQPESRTFTLMAPAGSYRAIRWLIGVDSARNVSGVQSGALDPANGMFWSWNTGYIFAKLEGTSSVSPAPLQKLTYHIGGFKQSESALKTITLNFPQTLVIQPGGHHSSLEVWANVDSWFIGVQPIHISTDAFCMSPGPLAQKISANYAQMFQVQSVSN